MKKITQTKLLIITAIFLVAFDNYSFFSNVLIVYPFSSKNFGFLLSIVIILTSLITFLFSIVSSRFTTKPILILVVIISSLVNYFMNTYQVVIDSDMIRNLMQTNVNEASDLFSINQILYLFILGVIPSYFIYKIKINYRSFKVELFAKIKVILISLLLIIIFIFTFSKYYSSFLREHKPLRYRTNPTYWIYSIGKYINLTFSNKKFVLKPLGLDAYIEDNDTATKKIVILVVGEAVRSDHFSLNGYERETNLLLKKENLISFSQMYSCGTSTAISVPCMFSIYNRSSYTYKKGRSTENVLDIIYRAGVNVLWRDNNSNSKGVAIRLPYEDFKSPNKNTICDDVECRDVGMLVGLDKYIKKSKNKHTLIILHQMGNHGPAYYKRYPKEFEIFTPTCKNQLEECSKKEIGNTYDNTLLYTDYFLQQTINFLKQYDKTHKVAMFYMSDHGQSLGENNIYLHGLPYFMAPNAQKHVASLLWLGTKMKEEIDFNEIAKNKNVKYSHENLFHTLLGLFRVKTEVYNKKLDILSGN